MEIFIIRQKIVSIVAGRQAGRRPMSCELRMARLGRRSGMRMGHSSACSCSSSEVCSEVQRPVRSSAAEHAMQRRHLININQHPWSDSMKTLDRRPSAVISAPLAHPAAGDVSLLLVVSPLTQKYPDTVYCKMKQAQAYTQYTASELH